MTSLQAREVSAGTIVLPLPRPGGAGRAGALAPEDRSGPLPLDQISLLLWTGTAFLQHPHGRAALRPRVRPLVALYTVLPEGTFRYDPAAHSLLLVTADDLRRWIDRHGTLRPALDLVYVDSRTRPDEEEWEECGTVAGADAAHIAQNIAGYCAAAGLVARVARRVAPQLTTALDLATPECIALVQRIGYPADGPH
jgi:hypothetical protein